MGLWCSASNLKEELLDILHDVDPVFYKVKAASNHIICHEQSCIHTFSVVMDDGNFFVYQKAHKKTGDCGKIKVKLIRGAAKSLRKKYFEFSESLFMDQLNQLL